jgi:hypothetical protein
MSTELRGRVIWYIFINVSGDRGLPVQFYMGSMLLRNFGEFHRTMRLHIPGDRNVQSGKGLLIKHWKSNPFSLLLSESKPRLNTSVLWSISNGSERSRTSRVCWGTTTSETCGVASHVKQLVERSNSVSGLLYLYDHVRKPRTDIREACCEPSV